MGPAAQRDAQRLFVEAAATDDAQAEACLAGRSARDAAATPVAAYANSVSLRCPLNSLECFTLQAVQLALVLVTQVLLTLYHK